MRNTVKGIPEVQGEDADGCARELCVRNDITYYRYGLKYLSARYIAVLARSEVFLQHRG